MENTSLFTATSRWNGPATQEGQPDHLLRGWRGQSAAVVLRALKRQIPTSNRSVRIRRANRTRTLKKAEGQGFLILLCTATPCGSYTYLQSHRC